LPATAVVSAQFSHFLLRRLETPKPKAAGITFAPAIERYLVAKVRKRTLTEDERILGHLKEHFGKDTALAEITASRISE
jgi:hypothetical protein